jgi:hypothetical protein
MRKRKPLYAEKKATLRSEAMTVLCFLNFVSNIFEHNLVMRYWSKYVDTDFERHNPSAAGARHVELCPKIVRGNTNNTRHSSGKGGSSRCVSGGTDSQYE